MRLLEDYGLFDKNIRAAFQASVTPKKLRRMNNEEIAKLGRYLTPEKLRIVQSNRGVPWLMGTHPQCSREEMKDAIKWVTAQITRSGLSYKVRTFLALLGRPITYSDISSLRSASLFYAIWYMPFSHIEPLLKSKGKILNKMLNHVGYLPAHVVSDLLSAHKDRVTTSQGPGYNLTPENYDKHLRTMCALDDTYHNLMLECDGDVHKAAVLAVLNTDVLDGYNGNAVLLRRLLPSVGQSTDLVTEIPKELIEEY